MPYSAFYHPHAYFWMVLIVLFLMTFYLYRANIAKGAKITHMVVRLLYVIMVGTGITLLYLIQFPATHILKAVIAIILVYSMEMILVKTKKGFSQKMLTSYWLIFLVTLVVVILLGYRVISF
ncbi:YisL family protein [Anaerobacillus isosaccharinicus]|uniref:YisL family protein n=1 Tax=Anaerobacillus isosaccharinicus TaxID=1532552 RepID=A0A1S2KY21_9BACI|nr:YisL family protein [Anaerobacillus isosaccharinicus]MBA5586736.1 YisL family protein [Anaerobacillus isosaccharinicus]QOY35042.1 YisL family protein [Anaerobacillus isosaccharinicus]